MIRDGSTLSIIYQVHWRNERYLRNIVPLARVGMVFSEQNKVPMSEVWQQKSADHASGMYHALIEARIPFEMVNDRLLDQEHLKQFRLLVLPDIVSLSDEQCNKLRQFVEDGGSLVATFETSLYDGEGKRRTDFGLSDLLGVSYDQRVEGPMQNSYLRLKSDQSTNKFHPVLKELEDAYRIINTVYQVSVRPNNEFPSPVTHIPTYPDLPMEHVYPRITDSNTRELYLRESGKSRVAYFPGDIDRTFWQIMCSDHGKLIGNTIKWALNEEPVAEVKGPGVLDVTVWRQKNSMTVHLVNMTNPMMMKGPFRELIPVAAKATITIPQGLKVLGVNLLVSAQKASYEIKGDKVMVDVPQIYDHEIIGIDL